MRPLARTWTAACGLIIASALTAGTAPARAGDDDTPLDTKILRSILTGIGLQDPNKAPIDYHERPPLVIPPDTSLPPPETADAAAQNPAWPKDPDIARAREIKRLEANRNTTEEIEREMHPLRPEEMTPGHNPRTPPSGRKISVPLGEEGKRLAPSELGYKGGVFGIFGGKSNEAVRFTGEPARASLTDPPPGYQTPSPEQPYGDGGKAPPPKAENYYEKHGTDVR
jgi:hypothetical protein